MLFISNVYSNYHKSDFDLDSLSDYNKSNRVESRQAEFTNAKGQSPHKKCQDASFGYI